MSVLVDSSVFIDFLRNLSPAVAVLEREAAEPIHSSLVVKIELLAGMRNEEAGQTRRLLNRVVWHEIDDLVAEHAGELARRWLPSHGGIETEDFIIAATAELFDLRLLTTKVKHFPMFPGLRPPY